MLLLNQQLSTVNRLALTNELPDAIINATGSKITPQNPIVPESAQALIDQNSNLLPRIKITELLPAPERIGARAARTGPHRTHAVHPGLATERRTVPVRACGAQ